MQTLNLEVPQMRPFGQQVGSLIRFGETWLNLDAITAIQFNPEDGCGCEIGLKGEEECWHMPLEDAECLRAYLTGFESIQQRVDAVKSDARQFAAAHPPA